MSRTYRKCAYTTERSLEKHLERAHRWYNGYRWVWKDRTEEEIAEAQKRLDAEYDRALKLYYSGLSYWYPYRRTAANYTRVQIEYPYEEFLKDETNDYYSHFRDGCNGHRRSYREMAIDGQVCGWRDTSASYKKIPIRIARRQQKLMIRKEIEDVVDFDL